MTARILPRSRPHESTLQPRFNWTPFLFIAPYLTVFFVFRLGPSIAGLGVSFTEWGVVGDPRWVGLRNYEAMLGDPRLGDAIRNTIQFTFLTVPLLVVIGLGLAMFFNQPRPGRALGRTAVFIPYVLMSTVVGVLWTWILEKDFGLLNVYLAQLGLPKIPWLVSSNFAMLGIVLTTVWWTVGYNMVLFLAGLQDIPEELYEAARIDGANSFGLFWYITLPLLAPTVFLVLLLTINNSLQVFDQVYVMTQGGPNVATLTLVHYIYVTAFQRFRFGYGAAIACLLFALLVGLALVQTRAYRRGLKGAGA